MPIDANEKRSQGSVHIDSLRGAAAIIVMLGHSREFFFQSATGADVTATTHAPELTPSGLAPRQQITIGMEAVMIFFVLSGYLVGGSVIRTIQRNRWSWKEYLGKRITRLWVVLLPALILTLALDHLGLRLFPESTSLYHGPPGQTEVRADLIKTLAPRIIVGNAFFLQNIMVPAPGTNIALWSLANEFWYYVIFPLLVLACWRLTATHVRILCAMGSAAILYFIGVSDVTLFPVWLFGAAIALFPLKLTARGSWWITTGLCLLLFPTMVLVRRLPFDIRLAQMSIGLYSAVLIYALLNRTDRAKVGLYPRIATILSDLSYPLYLVHLPILVILTAAVNRPWHHWTKTPAHIALVFAIDAMTIVVAYFFHFCFQRHTESVRRFLLGPLQAQQHVPVTGGTR